MATTDVVMYDEEFNQIKTILSKLRTDANAKLVFLGRKERSANRRARQYRQFGHHVIGISHCRQCCGNRCSRQAHR